MTATPELDALAAHAALMLTPEEVADLAAAPALLRGCSDGGLMTAGRRAAVQRDRAAALGRELLALDAPPRDALTAAVSAWFKALTWATAAADEMRRRWPEDFAAGPRLH